jgi:hypothetical protein
MPTITASPGIPPEIVDSVIDHIYHSLPPYQLGSDAYHEWRVRALERQALLGTCSLVSKSWLPRSRHLFFTHISLPHFQFGRAMAFLDLLDSPHSTIPAYARSLHLGEGLGRFENESRWLNAVLPQLTALYSLETLTISTDGCFDMQGPPTGDIHGFFASFQKLQTLTLTRCAFDTRAQIYEVLHSVPSLGHLTLDGLILNHPETDPVSTAPPTFSLRYLNIGHVDGKEHLIVWLASGTQISALSTLQLESIEARDSWVIGYFLRVLGSSLKSLSLTFMPNESKADAQRAYFH